jgi:putative MATE family efflux protein
MSLLRKYAINSAVLDNSTDAELRKKTFKLALPAILEMMMQTLLGFADMAMVGSLGPAAIAAIGLSDMPMMTAMAVFAAISVGTTALVARYIGAKEQIMANNVAKQSLIISVFMAATFTFLGLILAEAIVTLMGAKEDVIPLSVSYFKIVALGLPLMIITLVMSGVLRGSGDTKTPMYINGIANVVNIVGNFFMIYPSRNITLTLPIIGTKLSIFIPGAGLGVNGAAIATTTSRSLAGLAILFILLSGRCLVKVNIREKLRIDFSIIRKIFNIGVPAAIEQFFMRFGQLLFFRIVAELGTVMVAAHRITLTAESLSFMPGFGFALAATTLVGQYLGAEEPELSEKSGIIAVEMAAIVMSIVGILFFIWPDIFLKIFTREKEILESARWCLRIVALSQPFLAGVMGFSGALRGAGDTRRVLMITFIGIWGIRLTLAYLLAIVLKFGLIGAWIGMSIDLVIRGILFFIIFKSGKWKSIKV